jgi:hypothetical protein
VPFFSCLKNFLIGIGAMMAGCGVIGDEIRDVVGEKVVLWRA